MMKPPLSPPYARQETKTLTTAPIQEVFSSYQGEGLIVGLRQIFVRFAHCHLKCAFCDTPMVSASGQCHVSWANHQPDAVFENPVSVETAKVFLTQLLPQARHHSISFTGGEPLLYHRFLAELLPLLTPLTKIYLETSGTQPEFLEPILPWVDIIAMDLKLPSATGERALWAEHQAFLAQASQKTDVQVFAKVVFNDIVTDEELKRIIETMTPYPTIPVILQPETSLTEAPRLNVSEQTVFHAEEMLSRSLPDVRIIPQTHKMMLVR